MFALPSSKPSREVVVRPLIVGIAIVWCAVVIAPAARAGWSPDGVLLGSAGNVSAMGHVVSSDDGGFLFVWGDLRSAKSELFALHLDTDGTPLAGSPAGGVRIASRSSGLSSVKMVPDGEGGAFVAFVEVSGPATAGPFVTRVLADGSRHPGFPEPGILVGASPNTITQEITLFIDQAGLGLAWIDNGTARLQRMTREGAVAPGWHDGGLPVFTVQYDFEKLHAVTDGAGGAYLTCPDESDLVLRRISSAAADAPGWTASSFRIPGGGGPRTALLALPDSYVMVAFEGPGTTEPIGIRTLRATPTGAVAGNWTIEGLSVGPGYGPRIVSDGDLGAIVAWTTVGGLLYTQHVLASGSIDGAWPAPGRLMNGSAGNVEGLVLTPDGAGGAFLAWSLGASQQLDVQGHHVVAGGALASGWPSAGVAISTAPGIQDRPELASDGAGGMVVVWNDARDPVGHAMAARVSPDGIVPVLVSLASATAEPGVVRLRWSLPRTVVFAGAIERAENGGWIERARVRADAAGMVEWSDALVVAGRTYSYRLVDGERRVLDEVTIAVPLRSDLALAGFRPNPPDERFLLELSLPAASAARMDVLDVRGRRVAHRALTGIGAGRHLLSLGELRALPAGLYFVTLEQEGRRVTARLVRTQ